MNGVIATLWQQISQDLVFPSLDLHSRNPPQSRAWVTEAWGEVIDQDLFWRSPTDVARARLAVLALVEVHNEVVRHLEPQRHWDRDRYRIDALDDLPDLVIGYLAAEYLLAPSTGERSERVTLLEGLLHGHTRALVADHGDYLTAQVPVIAGIAGVSPDDPRLQGDLLRRFR